MRAGLAAAGILSLSAASPAWAHAGHDGDEMLGTVHFPTSCTAPAQTVVSSTVSRSCTT